MKIHNPVNSNGIWDKLNSEFAFETLSMSIRMLRIITSVTKLFGTQKTPPATHTLTTKHISLCMHIYEH